jgi:hypothetical protein
MQPVSSVRTVTRIGAGIFFVKSNYGRNQAKRKKPCKRCRKNIEENLNMRIKNR